MFVAIMFMPAACKAIYIKVPTSLLLRKKSSIRDHRNKEVVKQGCLHLQIGLAYALESTVMIRAGCKQVKFLKLKHHSQLTKMN